VKQFDERDIDRISGIMKEKYGNPDWIVQTSASFDFRAAKRYPPGKLDISVRSEKGVIRSVRIAGDFLGISDMQPLENRLVGVPMTPQSVEEKLSGVNLSAVLGGLSAGEFLDCLFGNTVPQTAETGGTSE